MDLRTVCKRLATSCCSFDVSMATKSIPWERQKSRDSRQFCYFYQIERNVNFDDQCFTKYANSLEFGRGSNIPSRSNGKRSTRQGHAGKCEVHWRAGTPATRPVPPTRCPRSRFQFHKFGNCSSVRRPLICINISILNSNEMNQIQTCRCPVMGFQRSTVMSTNLNTIFVRGTLITICQTSSCVHGIFFKSWST